MQEHGQAKFVGCYLYYLYKFQDVKNDVFWR